MAWTLDLAYNNALPLIEEVEGNGELTANQMNVSTTTGFHPIGDATLSAAASAGDGLTDLGGVNLKVYTPAGAGTGGFHLGDGTDGERIVATPYTDYIVSFATRSLDEPGSPTITMTWHDADGDVIGTETFTGIASPSPSGPTTRQSDPLTSPAGTASATLAFTDLAVGMGGDETTIYFDYFGLEFTQHAPPVRFRSASVHWELDGPGSIEVDLRPGTEDDWRAGQRRVTVRDDDANNIFQGWLTHLDQSGAPGAEQFKAAGLGLASILSYRVVHGDFSRHMDVSTDIAWDLIDHAQSQENGSELYFTLGTVAGTAPARSRDFCDGDVIYDRIEELAAYEPGGFDWEIDQNGAFNVWVGGRGSTSGFSIAPADVHEWSVTNETSDIASYATALSDDDQPCGDALVIVSDEAALIANDYTRREVVVSEDTNDAEELEAVGASQLQTLRRSSVRLDVSWLEGRGPWAFGQVWLGDTVEAELRPCFGGTQTMRVISITASLEAARLEPFVAYELELF